MIKKKKCFRCEDEGVLWKLTTCDSCALGRRVKKIGDRIALTKSLPSRKIIKLKGGAK